MRICSSAPEVPRPGLRCREGTSPLAPTLRHTPSAPGSRGPGLGPRDRPGPWLRSEHLLPHLPRATLEQFRFGHTNSWPFSRPLHVASAKAPPSLPPPVGFFLLLLRPLISLFFTVTRYTAFFLKGHIILFLLFCDYFRKNLITIYDLTAQDNQIIDTVSWDFF